MRGRAGGCGRPGRQAGRQAGSRWQAGSTTPHCVSGSRPAGRWQRAFMGSRSACLSPLSSSSAALAYAYCPTGVVTSCTPQQIVSTEENASNRGCLHNADADGTLQPKHACLRTSNSFGGCTRRCMAGREGQALLLAGRAFIYLEEAAGILPDGAHKVEVVLKEGKDLGHRAAAGRPGTAGGRAGGSKQGRAAASRSVGSCGLVLARVPASTNQAADQRASHQREQAGRQAGGNYRFSRQCWPGMQRALTGTPHGRL